MGKSTRITQRNSGAFLGLLMVFFGGTYVTTIAAVGFRQCGWERTMPMLNLTPNYEKAVEASKKDDDKDEDGDGIPDVQQSPVLSYTEEALLVAKAVNPDDVSNAFAGVWSGIFGVLCTLKFNLRMLSLLEQLLETSCTKVLTGT